MAACRCAASGTVCAVGMIGDCPMRRRLFNLAALVSVVVYLLTIAAFARSLWRSDQVLWVKVEDAPPARYH